MVLHAGGPGEATGGQGTVPPDIGKGGLLDLVIRSGRAFPQSIFLPVYQPPERVFQLATWEGEPKIEGLVVNAFFPDKQRQLREQLAATGSVSDFIGFDGLVTTGSGAVQGFTRRLYLTNKDIVRFQDAIGAHVIAPLDLATPPGDKRGVARKKLQAIEKRIGEALTLAQRSIVAGVQQGGRFLDLCHQSICRLMEIGVEYLALGSLVPFFNANHNLAFVAAVVCDVRSVAGPALPMHVYGAGDPCENPFVVSLGVTINYSAS